MAKQRSTVTATPKKGGGTVITKTTTTYIPPPPKPPKPPQKSICWVATAYYGDDQHPNVDKLRDFRESLLKSDSVGGFAMSFLNSLYLSVGRSGFGNWWANGLKHEKGFSIRRIVSHAILIFLLKIS